MANEEKEIGRVLDYFSQVEVAAIELTAELKIGDKIRFSGPTTNFDQIVESMQINRKPIEKASNGDDVGIKTDNKVIKHDKVFLIN